MPHAQTPPEFPDHTSKVPAEILAVVDRMHWQSARSVEHVAGGRHQYNVCGWAKDDVTEREFWQVADIVRAISRVETWTAPAGFYNSGRRPRLTNTYAYINGFAYWYTTARSTTHMLDREAVEQQLVTPTRSLPDAEPGSDIGPNDGKQLGLF